MKKLHFYGPCKHYMLTCLTLFLISTSSLFAQASKEQQDILKVKSELWQPLLQNAYVQIDYKYADCNLPSEGTHNEYYYLHIVNKTNKKIQVEWMQENWYNNKCLGCSGATNENKKKIILNANEMKEGSCSAKTEHALSVFSKMIAFKINSELTDFNIRNLKITFLN